MKIVILRHGEAAHAIPDRERSLTAYGRKQVESQYQWLKEQNFQPELILHSPYKRTIETASLAETFFPNVEMQVEPLITPDGNPELVAQLVPVLEKQQILIVSHMPMVSYLTTKLLPESALFSYPVAGLCWLEYSLNTSTATLLHKRWPQL
ncbi:MAG: phosphohistidine phosphatase [Enterobacterales bacterium]|jgi:phosphohistidine phosphatase